AARGVMNVSPGFDLVIPMIPGELVWRDLTEEFGSRVGHILNQSGRLHESLPESLQFFRCRLGVQDQADQLFFFLLCRFFVHSVDNLSTSQRFQFRNQFPLPSLRSRPDGLKLHFSLRRRARVFPVSVLQSTPRASAKAVTVLSRGSRMMPCSI